jgi:hypothetical protein
MIQFDLWVMLCLIAYLGLFSLESARVVQSLSTY